MKNIALYPSLISSDLLRLADVVTQLNPHVDGYHIDIMDGHFVPNITWGPMFVSALAKVTLLPLHVHCMVSDPRIVARWLDVRPQDLVIAHAEAHVDLKLFCSEVRDRESKVGIALNPQTPVETVFDYLTQVDQILIMSVNPGFSGQHFIHDVMSKIETLADEIARQGAHCAIGIDGGITPENIGAVVRQGATHIAAASAIFSAQDNLAALQNLYVAAKQ